MVELLKSSAAICPKQKLAEIDPSEDSMVTPSICLYILLLYIKIPFVAININCLKFRKRTKRVQGWSRQIGLGTLFAIHTKLFSR